MMRVLVLFAGLLILGGCAEAELAAHTVKQLPLPTASAQPTKHKGYFKTGRSYRISGKRYTPKEVYNYTETGVASWYGPNFHGKMTANGEIFDQNELTAAHRTLQMPALVRVTNLENGRSLVVRVNDRGPFSHGRVIDLSKRAAELLDFKKKGTAKVRLDLLTEESIQVAQMAKNGQSTKGMEIAANENRLRPMTVTETIVGDSIQKRESVLSAGNVYVQAGSFSSKENAVNLAKSLSVVDQANVETVMVRGAPLHRVRMGPFSDRQQADFVVRKLARNGYNGAQIVGD